MPGSAIVLTSGRVSVKEKDHQDQDPTTMISRNLAGPALLLALFLTLGRPQAATAAESKADDGADPATKVQRLNRYAMQLFDDLNFALAEKTLLEALAIVDKSNLANGPAGLATNGNLAVLYSVGLKNPDKAVFYFKKALAIKPDLRMSKQRATPETEANLARAKAEMAGTAPPPASEPAPKPAVAAKHVEAAGEDAIQCPTGGEVQAGDEITLKCVTSADLHPAAVMLYYKPSGSDEYQVLQMTKAESSGGATTWVAKIPGSQTKAKWIPVYFEARDEQGATLALSGREDSPSVIAIKGGETAAAGPEGEGEAPGEEEGEEEEDVDEEEIDDSNPLARLERERRHEREGSKGTWWVALGFGTGFGYASGDHTEAFGKKYGVGFNPGFALAGLGQAVPEVGYFIGRNTALSITGRLQAILPRGPAGTATGAVTGLLRILFYGEDEGKIRWYFAGVAGAGEGFRFQVDALVIDGITGKPTGQTVKDTVRGGPFVAGIGGGMLYKLGRHWRWTVDTQGLIGFGNVSAVLDLSSGARYQF